MTALLCLTSMCNFTQLAICSCVNITAVNYNYKLGLRTPTSRVHRHADCRHVDRMHDTEADKTGRTSVVENVRQKNRLMNFDTFRSAGFSLPVNAAAPVFVLPKQVRMNQRRITLPDPGLTDG